MPDENIRIDGADEINRKLAELHRRLTGGMRPLMIDIGETVLASIQHTFDVQGRPRWAALSETTTIPQREKINRWPGKILMRNASSGLLGSIDPDTVRSVLCRSDYRTEIEQEAEAFADAAMLAAAGRATGSTMRQSLLGGGTR